MIIDYRTNKTTKQNVAEKKDQKKQMDSNNVVCFNEIKKKNLSNQVIEALMNQAKDLGW